MSIISNPFNGVFDSDDEHERGMSEAVVVLLLIGIAVIVVALIAVFVFDAIPSGDDGTTAALSFEQNNDTITVFHGNGDDLPSDLTVEGTGNITGISHDGLTGLSPGQEGVINITEGSEGDRLSIVVGDTVVGMFELTSDVA